MKKRIIALMTAAALAIITTGCEEIDTTGSTEEKKTVEEHEDKSFWGEKVEFYIDPETGTEYLIFKFGSGDTTQWEVVPRYKPDGSIKALD